MKIESWDLARAQAAFEAMPAELRLVSLSPEFAAADTARDPALRGQFLGLAQEGHVWLHSIHLKPFGGSQGACGAISPYGYGSPVCTTSDPGFVEPAWQAYVRWCREHSVLAEFARFHPQARNERFFGGAVTPNRPTVSVDLTLADLTSQYNTLARRKLKRTASTPVRFSRDAADWQRYGAFYRAGMQAAGTAAWYLFGDAYFEALARLPRAWLCICGDWLTAGAYLFGDSVVEYHLGASSPQGHEAGTAYLMQHAAAERARAQGAHSLYLGGGTTPEPDNPLLFYKKCFSRRLLPFHVGQAIHDEHTYWDIAARHGFDREHPPARVLLD